MLGNSCVKLRQKIGLHGSIELLMLLMVIGGVVVVAVDVIDAAAFYKFLISVFLLFYVHTLHPTRQHGRGCTRSMRWLGIITLQVFTLSDFYVLWWCVTELILQ